MLYAVLRTALFFGLLILLLIAFIYPFVRSGRAMLRHVEAGRADLAAAESYAEQLMIGDALHRLELAEVEFDSARRELDTLTPLSSAPYVGTRIKAADKLLLGGLIAVSAVREALHAVQSVFLLATEGEDMIGSVIGSLPSGDQPFSDLTMEKKQAVLAGLLDTSSHLSRSVSRIDQALLTLGEVPQGVLDVELYAEIDSAKEKLAEVQVMLQTLATATQNLPSFLGYPDAKRYLLFFQNNTELRPTGGFLGVYGLAEVQNAELLSSMADDIYALDGPSEEVDRPAPPAPIQKYIRIDQWYLRDANWSPDFVESAKLMDQFYFEEAAVAGLDPQPIDGIVAFSPALASDLLRLVGPVTIDDKTFDADNLVDELEFAVEVGFREEGIPVFARKEIVEDLMKEVIRRLVELPLSRLVGALQLVERNLNEGHVLIWMKNPNLQSFVLDNDWGGRLQLSKSDYVTVIDANLAALKTDHAMSRNIDYSIRPVDGGYEARVAINYIHGGGFDWKTTRYRTYTRVYAPAGSELIRVEGALEDDRLRNPSGQPGTPDVYDELGLRVFGAFTSIEPGKTGTLAFVYRLPPAVVADIESGEYQLYFEKQPGTEDHGLTLDLDFGKNLTKAYPAEEPTEFGDSHYKYTTDLRLDREFSVGF